MKRVVGIAAALAVVLGVLAALFILPTLRLKAGLDRLASSLPPGITFTYRDARFDLLARGMTLQDVVVKMASPALEIHADAIEIDHGNPGLQSAIASARRAPGLQNAGATPIADRIVLTHLHTAYAAVDAQAAHAEIDDARLDLHQLFSPLPNIDAPDGGDAAYPQTLQKVALYMTAAAYRHAELDDIAVDVKTDEPDSQTVDFKAAVLSSDGFDHGNIAATTLKGFDIASGTFDMHVDTIAAGTTMHHDFWVALRDGAPLNVAVEKFQGASQTIENVKATSNGQPIASLDRLTFAHIGYKAGLPVSLDVQMTRLNFDPVLIPNPGIADLFRALGYKTVTLDGTVSYAWDQGTQTMHLTPATVVMDQGGTLNLSVDVIGADAKLPFDRYKLAGASLRYDDAGLAPKWLGYVASQTHNTPDKIKATYVQWLQQQKPAFKNDPALLAAFGGVETFINDPHSLLITLTPPQPVSLSEFDSTRPQTFTGKLGLAVTAPGSAPLPASPVEAAPGP